MTVLELLVNALASGVTLSPDGEELRIRGPRRAISLIQAVASRKQEVLQALAWTPWQRLAESGAEVREVFEERASIRQFDAGLTRTEAENAALAETLERFNLRY